eukprot:4192911-Amphidinium_carterae.1
MASYSEADNISDGVACRLCEGEQKFVAYKYASLFTHKKRVHKSTMKDFKGTFFQKEVNKELAAAEKARYKKKPKSIEDKASSAAPPPPPPPAPVEPCWKQMT